MSDGSRLMFPTLICCNIGLGLVCSLFNRSKTFDYDTMNSIKSITFNVKVISNKFKISIMNNYNKEFHISFNVHVQCLCSIR